MSEYLLNLTYAALNGSPLTLIRLTLPIALPACVPYYSTNSLLMGNGDMMSTNPTQMVNTG